MVEIPDWILDAHEAAVDDMLNSELAIPVTILYRPKMVYCVNCIFNPVGNKSSNVYRSGGPVPFPENSTCPMCNGQGYEQQERTDSMRMQIIWNPKDWVNIGVPLQIEDGLIQCKGFMTDAQKLKNAMEIQFNVGKPQIINTRWILYSEPVSHGFRNMRYFLAFLKRA